MDGHPCVNSEFGSRNVPLSRNGCVQRWVDNMWLIEIFDLDAGRLRQVENAIRVMEGVTLASALRDGQPYVVVGCPNQSDAMRVQHTVAAVDPAAIVVITTEGAGEPQELVGS